MTGTRPSIAEPKEAPVELTPEEVKKIRKDRAEWYQEQATYLQPQLNYQRIVSEIELCKATTAEAQLKQAQIYLAIQGGKAAADSKHPQPNQRVTRTPTPPGKRR